jgi:HEAT repeat protein
MLACQDVQVQRDVLLTLRVMGAERQGAVPGIAQMFTRETNTNCIALAKDSLLQIDPESVVPALCKGLRENPNWQMRRTCIAVLDTLHLPLKSAVEPLREALNDPNGQVRLFAAAELWKLTQDKDLVISIVTKEIHSPDKVLARQALGHFSRIQRAKEALPVLLEALADEDSDLRKDALQDWLISAANSARCFQAKETPLNGMRMRDRPLLPF